MSYTSGFLFCCVLTLTSNLGTLADLEDRSEELGLEQGKSGQNETAGSLEIGPPDSHEAMNNRELKAIRDKRSYEFLMGLINNNSKYEITKIEPTANKPTNEAQINASASELLLELLVKIAAHPDHWSKVHNLLARIDNDLLASTKIVDEMKTAHVKIETKAAPPPPARAADAKRGQPAANTWPTFGEEEARKPPYQPKAFAYQRVTGRPMYLNKHPRAYIAVSVIAPKAARSGPAEDLTLEKELRQLKPWTHEDNLQNMAAIRAGWVIDGGKGEQNAP